MIRITVPAVVCLLAFYACGRKEEQNVLSEKEMSKILVEMYLSDEKISRAGIPYDSIAVISPVIRNRVLQRLGISDSVYLHSMEYYMSHPEMLDRIYGRVVDSLSLLEQRNNVIQPGHDTPAGF
ncbi:MAG: hypothetical protein KatS3mg032_0428 [Cyclobacteriaceae bacterium]|nr:MAG: hypothetical protein KatS3mg032_0428 [Cyclobacteriaceae bacterium]